MNIIIEQRTNTLNQLNMIRQQEQECLQELLRIDGEVRVLQRLAQKEAGQETPQSDKIQEPWWPFHISANWG